MIELGDEVQSVVTGQKGIVIGISDWLTGCKTMALKGKVGKDGKAPESSWYDEIELKITKKNKFKLAAPARRDIGGPHDHHTRILGPKI